MHNKVYNKIYRARTVLFPLGLSPGCFRNLETPLLVIMILMHITVYGLLIGYALWVQFFDK